MKTVLIVLALVVTAVGCSSQATKDTRAVVNQNSADIAELQARPEVVVVEQDGSCPAACNEAIDRAFLKSQMK